MFLFPQAQPRRELFQGYLMCLWKISISMRNTKILLWMFLWPPQVTVILGDTQYFWICYCLNSFAKPSYRFMEKQAIWLVIKQFHTLSVKIPAALFGFSGTALLPGSFTAAQFHSISTVIYNNWVWSEAIRKRQKHLASGLSINEKHIPNFILLFHLF